MHSRNYGKQDWSNENAETIASYKNHSLPFSAHSSVHHTVSKQTTQQQQEPTQHQQYQQQQAVKSVFGKKLQPQQQSIASVGPSAAVEPSHHIPATQIKPKRAFKRTLPNLPLPTSNFTLDAEDQTESTELPPNSHEADLVQLPLPTLSFTDVDDQSTINSYYLPIPQLVDTTAAVNTNNQVVVDDVDDEDENIDLSFDVDAHNELLSLSNQFATSFFPTYSFPQTDYNNLTCLPVHPVDVNFISLPVNSFSCAVYTVDGSLATSTPYPRVQNTDIISLRQEIGTIRSALSFSRHHMLSSDKCNLVQLTTSLDQIQQYIAQYKKYAPNPSFVLSNMVSVDVAHRRQITNYLFQLVGINDMSFETFANSLYLFDRVCSIPSHRHDSLQDIQLTGLVCLFLSYKMIEKRIASAATISKQTRRFTKEQIEQREERILNSLFFNVTPVSLTHIINQLLFIFSCSQQRDIIEQDRYPTDNIGLSSGRFLRLRHMLHFYTAAILGDFSYTQYNPFALACSIFIVALATIESDFTQIWPLSMSILTGVVPQDLMSVHIPYVCSQIRIMKQLRGGENDSKFLFGSILELYANRAYYHVSSEFNVPSTTLLNHMIEKNTSIITSYLDTFQIPLKTIQRISAFTKQNISVNIVVDQRSLTRHPLENANITTAQLENPLASPTLRREHQQQSTQTTTSRSTEYLVIMVLNSTTKNCFDISDKLYDEMQVHSEMQQPRSLFEQSLVGTNPVTIKAWMTSDSIHEFENGAEALGNFYRFMRQEDQKKKAAAAAAAAAASSSVSSSMVTPQKNTAATRQMHTTPTNLGAMFQSPKRHLASMPNNTNVVTTPRRGPFPAIANANNEPSNFLQSMQSPRPQRRGATIDTIPAAHNMHYQSHQPLMHINSGHFNEMASSSNVSSIDSKTTAAANSSNDLPRSRSRLSNLRHRNLSAANKANNGDANNCTIM